MHLNFNFISSITNQYSTVFAILFSFLLGALFSYIWFLGKNKKDMLDKKKLESYVKGINYIIEDDTDKAIEEFTETAKLDPDLIDIYISIGNLFRKKGEINRALIIHKSLLVRPHLNKQKKIEIYINIGVDYRKAGLYDRSKEYFKNALTIDPKNTLAKKLLYEVYEDSKDWDNALVWHKRFAKGDEHRLAHIYTEIGKEKIKENNPDQAKKNFEKALKVYPSCVDAYVHLGDIYMNYGDMKNAYKQWEKACKIKPEFADTALNKINDISALKSVIKNLLVEFPDNIYILYFCANQLFNIEEKKKALSLYKKLSKMNVKSYSVFYKLIEIQKNSLPDFVLSFAQNNTGKSVQYTCTNCGYSTRTQFFICPKCRQWDMIRVDIL